MGSVRVRKESGELFLDFRYEGQRRREQTLLTDSPGNRKRLEKVLAKIEAQIEAGTFDYAVCFPNSKHERVPAPVRSTNAATSDVSTPAPLAGSPLFSTFAVHWLAEHKIEWRRSHIKVLESTLNGHLLPFFGAKTVASITKTEVLAFRSSLAALPGRGKREGLSHKRINGIMALLRQILNEAADRHEFVSPTLNLKPLKLRKTDVEPFTLDEVQTILHTVRADYRDYFTVRFFTGMRTGEAHGLKWKYVDFSNRLILIRETFVLGEDEYTKTDSSQRHIQMSQVVFDALQRQHGATAKLSEYVFCNRDGKPLDNKNFSDRVWYPLLRHLALSRRRPYQMRHTAATLWLASGEAPEWIARQLGHSSTQMLFRVYSRYVPNLTRRDGSAIDRLLTSRLLEASSSSAGANDAAAAGAVPTLGEISSSRAESLSEGQEPDSRYLPRRQETPKSRPARAASLDQRVHD